MRFATIARNCTDTCFVRPPPDQILHQGLGLHREIEQLGRRRVAHRTSRHLTRDGAEKRGEITGLDLDNSYDLPYCTATVRIIRISVRIWFLNLNASSFGSMKIN